jgi:hypothetical protein
MTAWSTLEARTGAGTSAADRVCVALRHVGYRIERSDYIVYPSYTRPPGTYLTDLPRGTAWSVSLDGKTVSTGHALEGQAWHAAAAHALEHRQDRLPPAYSGPGTVWPIAHA